MTMVAGTSGITISTSATRNITGDTFTNQLVGALPAGMSFNTSTRAITGTPTQVGVFPIQIVVTLSTDPAITATKNYVIEVVADPNPSVLKILTETLPFGKATASYSTQILAAGGTGTRSFAIVADQSSARRPTGLAIKNAGVLTCNPSLADSGLYKIAIRYTMGTSNVVKVFDLYIAGVLTAEPVVGTTMVASPGMAFSRAISVSGGFSGDYFFKLDTIAGDALPAGLSLIVNDDHTAQIAGTPAAGTEGTYNIAIYVNETFAGSPVDSVLYYKLIVGPKISLARDGLTAKAGFEMANPYDGSRGFNCILAIYDQGGKLVDFVAEKTELAGQTAKTIELSAGLSAGYAAKAFIWDDTYVPVCQASVVM